MIFSFTAAFFYYIIQEKFRNFLHLYYRENQFFVDMLWY